MKTKTKIRKHGINQKIGLHNEFTLKITEFEDEKCETIKKEWEAKAYNIILNQGMAKIIRHIGDSVTAKGNGQSITMTDNGAIKLMTLGGYIHFGSGNTTPAITDTTLTTYIGNKQSTSSALVPYTWSNRYAEHTQYITLLPADNVGATLKEVGLAGGTVTTDLTTKALIVDSEGSPLTITKTATMQITIYAKVYFILDTITYTNVDWINGGTYGNSLLYAVANNKGLGYSSNLYARCTIMTGTNSTAIDSATDEAVETLLATSGLQSSDGYTTSSPWTTSWAHRFETNQSNGKIKEVGVRMDANAFDTPVLFRSVMPVTGIWAGTTFTDVEIGTGDGVEDEFTIGQTDQLATFWTWNEINSGTLVVKVNGVTQTETTDYTYNDTTGVITFTSIPPSGHAVTASWTVPYIAKSNDYVLDIYFELTLTEGTVPT